MVRFPSISIKFHSFRKDFAFFQSFSGIAKKSRGPGSAFDQRWSSISYPVVAKTQLVVLGNPWTKWGTWWKNHPQNWNLYGLRIYSPSHIIRFSSVPKEWNEFWMNCFSCVFVEWKKLSNQLRIRLLSSRAIALCRYTTLAMRDIDSDIGQICLRSAVSLCLSVHLEPPSSHKNCVFNP